MRDDLERGESDAWAPAVTALLALALLGCVPGRIGAVDLYLSLRTDFVPAEEFTLVRVVITTTDGRQTSRDEIPAEANAPYLEGAAILERAAPPGAFVVELTLVGRAGGTVARRRLAVDALGTAPQAVTVLISRNATACDESACPPGETCGRSGCVDVRCRPEAPERCPPTECSAASDCPARAACASAACASGACLYGAREGACGAGEYCDAAAGCLPRTTPVGDVGRRCTRGDECASGVCVDTGETSACTSACESASDCMSGWTCGPAEGAAGDVCVCATISPEVCSGADEDCDGYVDEGGVCSADAGTPCGDGDACASGVCAPIGGDASACTMACRSDGDCLAGWACGTVEGVEGGACRCTSSAEICSEEDEDCDGRVDEGGVCGSAPGCTPAPETCNLADDDCDSFCDDGASCRRPVHRAFHPGEGWHLYSQSLIEITSRPSLAFEAQDYFQLYLVSQPGLVPLRRCYWEGARSHLLTTRADCEGAADEGVLGYLSPTPTCGSIPLYELRSEVSREDYVYTVSGPERQALLAEGMRSWGIVGHVWPSEWRCTSPVDEDCANGLDDDCDGLTDCADPYDCCSSGDCQGIRTPGAYRIRCCERGWVNIARSENHCGGCNAVCQAGHHCNPDGEGSGHCGCDASDPWCPRGQSCLEQRTPRDGTLAYRCSCSADDQCAYTFACRGLGDSDDVHNVCHPTQ